MRCFSKKLTITQNLLDFVVGLRVDPFVDASNSFGAIGKIDLLNLGVEVFSSDSREILFHSESFVHENLVGHIQCNIRGIL